MRTGTNHLFIPGPTNVPDRVLRAIDRPTIDHRGPEFGELGLRVLAGLKRIFQTTQPVVIFPASGTGAWEAALVNTMSPGDALLMVETGHFAALWFKNTALVMLSLTLWGALRSFRMAMLGMIPNVLPCLLLYGTLAMFDRPLGVANAMIGSVMLGLIVDNTIHFLHHFRHGSGNGVARVQHAIERIASPMIGSSIVLVIGFGAGLLGGMESTHEFAILAAATIGLALVGDGVLLPALLLSTTRHGEGA